jgi:hypothetical protein
MTKSFTSFLSGSLLVALSWVAAPSAQAQQSPVPASYSFPSKEDYAKYSQQVIETVGWLEKTPANQQPEQRQAAGRFLMEWMSGSPAVAVQLHPYFLDLCPKSPDELLLFMGGWSRYQLQHPESTDAVAMHVEGLKTVLQSYQVYHAKTNKKLEALQPLLADGKLPQWVEKKTKG